MTIKQSQGDFEDTLKKTLQAKAHVKKIEVAADVYLKRLYGIGHASHPFVSQRIVERFGTDDKSVRCMDYILQQVVGSGQVSDTYKAGMATIDAWNLLEEALKAGTNFDFAQEPNQEFYGHLRIVGNQ